MLRYFNSANSYSIQNYTYPPKKVEIHFLYVYDSFRHFYVLKYLYPGGYNPSCVIQSKFIYVKSFYATSYQEEFCEA